MPEHETPKLEIKQIKAPQFDIPKPESNNGAKPTAPKIDENYSFYV